MFLLQKCAILNQFYKHYFWENKAQIQFDYFPRFSTLYGLYQRGEPRNNLTRKLRVLPHGVSPLGIRQKCASCILIVFIWDNSNSGRFIFCGNGKTEQFHVG